MHTQPLKSPQSVPALEGIFQTRTFVRQSLRPWRFRVLSAHMVAIALGLVTASLGLVIGPVMQALFAPSMTTIPWSHVIGPIFSELLKDILPAGGLDSEILVQHLPQILVGIATLKATMTFYQWFTWEWLGEQLAKRWRDQVAADFVKLRNEVRDDGLVQAQEASLGGVIAQDIRVLREFVVHYFGGLPREGLQVVFTAVTLFLLSPKLFGIFVLCIAPVGALLSRVGRRLRKRAKLALNDYSQMSEWIQQRLLGLETIKHYGSETAEATAMQIASTSLYQRYLAAARLKSRTSPMIEIFGVCAMSIALWVAFHDIALGQTSGTIMMSFFSGLALLSQSAAKLGRYFNSNQEGNAAGKRLLDLLHLFSVYHEQVVDSPQNQASLVQATVGRETKLVVQNLTVAYRSQTGDNHHTGSNIVIRDLSFEFLGGKVYCLVGKSGAGKSSLFQAILGLRPPVAGDIELTISPEWVDSDLKILHLPQTVAIVPTTLARNVAYPHLSADAARVAEALSKASFNLLLNRDRLVDGVESLVGPGFLQLSGGEAQRLQLARMHYHHSPFILVDEGTSALDPMTEAEVLTSLRGVANSGACVVMIAHKRAAVDISDEVLVMEDGKIVATGKPTEVQSLPAWGQIFGH